MTATATELADALLIEQLCRDIAGKGAADCDWRDVIRVRDHVDRLLNRAIDERQFSSASTARPLRAAP